MVLIYFIANQFLGGNSWIWHLLLSSLYLLSAVLLFHIFELISTSFSIKPFKTSQVFINDCLVVVWLSFPWALGWSAWPTLLMGMIALVFILLFTLQFCKYVFSGKNISLMLIYYGVSIFAYETFYFYYLFVAGFLLFYLLANKLNIKLFWRAFVGLSILQICAVIYNRINSVILVGSSKPGNVLAANEWFQNIKILPTHLTMAFPGTAGFFIWIAMTLIISYGVITLFFCFNSSKRKKCLFFLLVSVGGFVGIGLSVFLYSLAYYGLIGIGTMSRTTLGVSLYLAFIIYAMFQVFSMINRPYLKAAIYGLAATGIFLSTQALMYQSNFWVEINRQMELALEAAPVRDIANTPSDALIVYVGPTDFGPLTFALKLPLTGALWDKYPEVRLQKGQEHFPKFPGVRLVLAKSDKHELHWDGKDMELSLPGHWTEREGIKKIYEWDAYRNTYRKMQPGEMFGENPQRPSSN